MYRKFLKPTVIGVFILLFLPLISFAQKTETLYLSGTGADKTVDWEFFCSAGMNSGKWTTIPVPSCWELQGFGSYNYGHDKLEDRLNETGQYRYSFKVPSNWSDKEVLIVFDGVMTDASVKINGKQAGPVHQGAFYRFNYNITDLLKFGKENTLEVFVKKSSDNRSVTEAERKADFWVFGGIFRPVWLEARPKNNISRVAIDAKADGSFKADVLLSGTVKNTDVIRVDIQSLDKPNSNTSFDTKVIDSIVRVEGKLNNPHTWTPESPNRYRAVFSLLNNGKIVHQHTETIGFRTIEVRAEDGVYVNGVRIKMQGVNRHTFHPDFGRTSSKALSIQAVNLMKDMNMNTVRMSHYSPDKHFLEVCDSLGLFVLDELTAWQKPSYDDVVGRKLLEELIARDVNHPSIIFWDNGNEGGENNNLNDDFGELDIQKREVLHPWQDYEKTNTIHYIDYNYLALDGFSKRKIFFPTEFLHGLYDGGHGAGLEDYWLRMWNDPLCAGGFLWVFADESVKRTDRNGELDSDGNHAPDGIVGPYSEKEGSFYTIKEIWAPIHFEKRYITPEFNGIFRIENRYFYTNLTECKIEAEWVNFSIPDADKNEIVTNKELLKISLEPGQKGILKVPLPSNWQQKDALRITATDRYGRHMNTWSWPVKTPEIKANELILTGCSEAPTLQEDGDLFNIKAGSLRIIIRKSDGFLISVEKEEKVIPLSNGPFIVGGRRELKEVKHEKDGTNINIIATFNNNDSFTWTIGNDGQLALDVSYAPEGRSMFAGISFNFPEEEISGMKWLGNGPYRVYKNRMKGVNFGLWEKAYNNTITGESGFEYPEFKGYHSELYWVEVQTKNVPGFKVFVKSKDIFLRMLTPEKPKAPEKSDMTYPPGDLSFLHGINAIGTKFLDPGSRGPQSNTYQFQSPKIHGGKLNMSLIFQF